MILSFTWTTDALLAGKKTCTRRVWSERTARAWVNAYQGDRLLHSAWDKMPLCRGAKKIADIQLTHLPYRERLKDMPESDLDAESGLWKSRDEFINLFGSPERVVWVVRFRLVMPPRRQSSSNELLVQILDNWNQPASCPIIGQLHNNELVVQ